MKKNVVAIIPVRSGSTGLPGKNIKVLFGKTLLEHNINLLKNVDLIDRIIVTTDSEEYRKIAVDSGAEAPFVRPEELSGKYATTEDTLVHAINWLKENENYTIDIIVYQQVNDLFKRKQWIIDCIKALLNDETLDTAFAAELVHKNYWHEVDGKPERLTTTGHIARQLKRPVYREDTGLACATRARLLTEEKRRIGDNVKIISHHDFCIDIHDEFDLELARMCIERFPELKDRLQNG